MKILIYKLVDPQSNEIRYVGRTSNSLNRRLSDHVSSSHSNHNSYKRNWIKKLAKSNQKPIIELIQELDCSWEESHEIEKSTIANYLKEGHKLVNLQDKGCGHYGIQVFKPELGKNILQYDLDGNFIKEWESLGDAARFYNTDRRLISKCLHGSSIKSNNFMWHEKLNNNIPLKVKNYYKLYNEASGTKIIQYSTTGEFIKIHSSYKSAAREIGIKSQVNLQEAIELKTCIKNYQWRKYEENYPLKISKYKKNTVFTPIKAVGEITLTFNSLKEAGNHFKCQPNTIKNWCKNNLFKKEYTWYFS